MGDGDGDGDVCVGESSLAGRVDRPSRVQSAARSQQKSGAAFWLDRVVSIACSIDPFQALSSVFCCQIFGKGKMVCRVRGGGRVTGGRARSALELLRRLTERVRVALLGWCRRPCSFSISSFSPLVFACLLYFPGAQPARSQGWRGTGGDGERGFFTS